MNKLLWWKSEAWWSCTQGRHTRHGVPIRCTQALDRSLRVNFCQIAEKMSIKKVSTESQSWSSNEEVYGNFAYNERGTCRNLWGCSIALLALSSLDDSIKGYAGKFNSYLGETIKSPLHCMILGVSTPTQRSCTVPRIFRSNDFLALSTGHCSRRKVYLYLTASERYLT